ncbi:cotton fiber protein [Rhynchospora pubera]|uniref:Cotton fiber protein n=1 Tax=Rhynchospora pubera TaxID=906938 RepID=A0AAV8HD40_9POAL|nr:cotton fiber protein [Rhynchospora pubera]
MMETTITKSALLNKLKNAIQKVKFLLSFDATRWVLCSIRGSFTPRKVSFKAQPSLLDCTDDATPVDLYGWASNSASVSRTTSNASQVTRTSSNVSSSDDIDKRAEIFITNFYKHIQMERQVSLELRYCREQSLERTGSI